MKKFEFSLIFAQNIDCRYYAFCQNKKIMYNRCTPVLVYKGGDYGILIKTGVLFGGMLAVTQ